MIGGALLPAAAHAGILSNLVAVFSGAAKADTFDIAQGSSHNLQTVSLPKPAMNINPTPAIGGGDITVVNGSALLPEEGPSGTIADIEQPANATVRIYTVQQDDTLESVAQQNGVSVATILSFNDLTRDSKLQPGQRLVILPTQSVAYTVKKGDTLASIAKATGSDANEIAIENRITDDTLAAGQTIRVPNGELPAQPTPIAKPKPKTSPLARIIPDANNPDEPSHNVGRPGTLDQVAYYMAPLAHYIQTQGIHGYNGVDLAAPEGTPIRAAASGVVTVAREGGWNGGYGSYVVISHGNGSQTLYGHMSSVKTYDGDHVTKGEIIGYVGETGMATGPHLHFEIRNGIRNPF